MATLRHLTLVLVVTLSAVSLSNSQAQDVIDQDYSDSRYDFRILYRYLDNVFTCMQRCELKNDIFIAVLKILVALALSMTTQSEISPNSRIRY